MIKGHIIFKTGITGPNSLILKPMQLVRADYPEASLISVETPPDENALQVTVDFEEIPSHEAASTLGHVLAETVADRVAFQFKLQLGTTVETSSSFEAIPPDFTPDGHKISTLRISQTFRWNSGVGQSIAPSDTDILELEALLTAAPSPKDEWHSRFRWIMDHADPVSKFLHLYSVLLKLVGGKKESQAPLDDFIRKHEKNVPQQTVTYNDKTVTETIYSQLRNEISHVRPGVTPQATREAMRLRVDKLAEHVKMAIELRA